MRAKITLDPAPKYISNQKTEPQAYAPKRKISYLLTEVDHEKELEESNLIGVVNDYLSKHIEIVNESRSK